MHRNQQDRPALITDAHESDDVEFARRRKKYGIMMALRALCVIGAAASYHLSIYVAMTFIAGGVVLPWCAVLIANDGPARKRQPARRIVAPAPERALPQRPGDDRIIDG